MKFCYLWICLFVAIIAPCRSDFEFGRAAFDTDVDVLLLEEEEAMMRDLMYFEGDMSMSMSMSMSFSYGYGGDGESHSGSGSNSDDEGGSNGDGENGGGDGPGDGSPTTPSIPSPSASPASTPTLASPSLGGPSSSPATAPAIAPVSSVGSPSANTPTAEDAACFDLPSTDFASPLFVETSRSSVSYALLENLLEDAMRGSLPFCEDITNALNISGYYIGNVDVAQDELGATCTPNVTENNCFVAALTLRLFGNYTDEDVTEILVLVGELLKTDSMGEALGVENGLIDWNDDNTETDGGQNSGDPQASTKPRQMSAGRKALISVLVILAVLAIAVVAYYRCRGGFHGYDATEGNDDGNGSGQHTTDRDHLFGA